MNLGTILETYFIENGFEDLNEYEGFYKINRNGDIWSCRYKKIMSAVESQGGYMVIGLTKNGKQHQHSIHRLLGIQYIENPDNLPEIDHIDRNRKNNDLSNLRWADKKTQCSNTIKQIPNATKEDLNERRTALKEYQRIWAENKRRENGVKPKITFESEEERQAHYKEKSRETKKKRIEEMTPEEKQEYYDHKNEINRKSYAKRIENMSEEDIKEFRQQALERSKKQRENENKEAVRKYKAEWARNKRKQLSALHIQGIKDAKHQEN